MPDAGSPVSHTVAPFWPSVRQRSSRVRPPSLHTTLGERPDASAGAPPLVIVSTIIPAPTVSFVPSSTRMKLPVVRLRR